jgi:putative ABC transport system permease protein
MNGMMQDVRYALRQMARAPGFTVTAVLTLALGIGANTAIFTVFNQVLLRMLPVERPQELEQLRYIGSNTGRTSSFGGEATQYFSYPMYRALRDQNTVFSGMLANVEASVGVSWKNQPETADAELVSGNYFEVLGVPAALGRTLLPSDDVVKNGSPVVVVSDSFWRNTLGAAKDVVNQTLLLNGHPFTIVGVAAPGFSSAINGFRPKLFIPITMEPQVMPGQDDLANERSVWLNVVARLKPGVTPSAAQAGLSVLWKQLRAEELKKIPKHSAKFNDHFVAQSSIVLDADGKGFSPLRNQLKTPLLILMGMVLLLAAMTCMNLANLLLVRGASRGKEFAVRFALGAARGRLLRQMLVEGLLLGGIGGLLGLAVAPSAAAFLIRRVTDATGETVFATRPDLWVLGFNLLLSVCISVLFSLAPAWQMMKPELVETLRQQTGAMLGGAQRFRTVAIGLQIGLSVLLLSGAGLFVRTLDHLKAQKMGIAPDHLVLVSVDPTLAGFPNADVLAVQDRVRAALAALPGVKTVGATNDPLLENDNNTGNVTVEGYTAAPEESMDVEMPSVTPGYFAALGIPILAGREFTEADRLETAKVGMVTRNFAIKYFGSVDRALGHAVYRGDEAKVPVQIVGVAGDTKHRGVREGDALMFLRPVAQSPEVTGLKFYVRTTQDPKAAENMIRAAVHGVDPKLIADGMKTMDEQIDSNVSNERMIALLAACFSLIALLTTAVGLYGVLAYATAQRTREIGIRMALGARRWSVVRLVLGDMAKVAGVAIVIALPVSAALSRLMRSQLFEVSPFDPWTLAVCALVTAAMVLVAAAVPARRAASVEPTQALRTE